MANLFIVFTPFQLFVAQQIISQEKLNNNILIEGYVQHNHHFIQIYDLIKINKMWNDTILFPDISYWDGYSNKSIHDIISARKNYKRLCNIVESYQVDTIYMGEMQNTSIRFLDIIFSHKGIKTIFFEEGTAHYITRPYNKNISLKLKIKIILRDILYYIPFYGVRFAKWRYIPNYPSTNLPIFRRYSIVPQYSEIFDKRLYIQELYSDELLQYMEHCVGCEGERILLLTDPLAELIGTENMRYYYETIEESFLQIKSDTTLYIKFHPRDSNEAKREIVKLANKHKLNYKILSNNINIPVEYFLQKYSFKYIYIFNASTYLYQNYIFTNQRFIKLLPILYKKIHNSKTNIRDISFVKVIIDRMN